MKTVINIIGWIVLLLAFASLGLSSDDPIFGFFFYLAFFLIVFGLVYYYISKHQKRKSIDPGTAKAVRKISGVLLILCACFCPILFLAKIELPFLPNLLIFLGTIVLIALGILAIMIINRSGIIKLLGLIMLIVLSSVPAIFGSTYLSVYFPNAYNALGTSYWITVAIAILSWWGISLFSAKD